MLIARTLSLLLVLISLPLLSGCVGPNAHGPLGGCCGPIALGGGCNSGGCTDCGDGCSGCGELYVDPWINNPADCVDPCDTCGNYNGQSCGKCRPMFEGIRSLWGYRCGNDCGCGAEPTCAVSTGGFLGGCKCGVESCDGGCGECYLEPSCGIGGGCDGGCGSSCGPSCGCEGGCSSSFGPSCGCEGGCASGCGASGGCESCGGVGGDEIYLSHDDGEYNMGGAPTPAKSVADFDASDKAFQPERQRKIFNPRPRVATGQGRSLGY